MNLILDNHTFDPGDNTDPNVEEILIPVWRHMAEHYKDRSQLIYYEILNEPHGISLTKWNTIQQNVINAIREIDSMHTIIVGAANWNSYEDLNSLPIYSDTNLIYTFHFYAPFLLRIKVQVGLNLQWPPYLQFHFLIPLINASNAGFTCWHLDC
ncbi:MAG: cellulase family glycosylhydrolase [Ignavibacteriales bacterium]|nr:cellulase family glycosylhydrolase [Ignavibacteriales bacterium]